MKFASVIKCDPTSNLTEVESLRYMNNIINRRLGSEWIILSHFTENLRVYNFGLCIRLEDSPNDDSIAEISYSDETVKFSFPWGALEVQKSEEALISLDVSLISIFSFRNPQFIISEGLTSSVLFYTNPWLWSDPSLAGDGISSIYRKISKELELKRRYKSFVRSLHFLSGIDQISEFFKVFRALSLLGIAPPLTKADLFLTQDLSPAEMKVLRVLCAKEAVDRIPGLSIKQVISLLSNLIPTISSNPHKIRIQRSLSNRGLGEGLTLTELSLIVGMDKAYLWRYVLPKMVRGCLVVVERDRSRGKEVKVYRPNSYLTLVSDLIMTYDFSISHFLRKQIT